MRTMALATVAAAVLIWAGAAEARVWTDPAGRVKFDTPAGWTVNAGQLPPGTAATYEIAGNANAECHVLAIERANLQNVAARDIRRTAGDDAQFNDEKWTQIGNSMNPVFPNNSAHVVSHSADHTPFFPIQRAEMQAPQHTVHAAFTVRPGLEISVFCQGYDGADPVATFDAFIHSVGNPNDATWQAQAEQQETEHAATAQQQQQAAAQQQQQQAQQQQQQHQTRNSHGERGLHHDSNTPPPASSGM